MNYLEQLLAKIEDQEARGQFQELATKHQIVNEWLVDPELKAKTEQISQWADTEWDYDHGMSKLEYAQQQQIAGLQTQVDARGNGMELNELSEYLGKYIKDKGLMTRAEVDAEVKAKETAFNEQLGLVSTLATRIPYLNSKYQKDFGEAFDPDDFITKANEAGYSKYGAKGLDEFYGKFTAEKSAAKATADMEAKLAAAREEGKRLGEEERRASVNATSGAGGDVGGSPEMGHFEARIKGMQNGVDLNAGKVPENLPLGQTARYAAALMDAKDRSAGRVN